MAEDNPVAEENFVAGDKIDGFSGASTSALARLVASSIHHDSFEYVVKLFYPEQMDEAARLSLLTAINHNISKNRMDYFLERYGIDLSAPCSFGLAGLSEGERVVARREIKSINRRFEAARILVEDYNNKEEINAKEELNEEQNKQV